MTAATRRDDARSEAFRSLRSTIKFAEGDAPVRSVLIVDTDRSEVSDSAEQVARAFGNAGDSCAFVDANFRQASGASPGFTDLLTGGSSLDDVVKVASTANGYTSIGCGTVANPDLLAGDQVVAVLDALLDRFDYVLLSTASLPENSDAVSLAPRVDATILVVTSGKTRRPRAIAARDALERVGARVLGVVLLEARRRLFW